jgi:DNA repair exonuclease SbcCD ATPase subunit
MRIKKIEWRNFSSYGNRTQEIEFGEEANLYQVVGENGAGKSSISQVITFGLYGKLDGKKLKDIPNRINGNAWVKITLDSNGSEVVVERGLEPSIFRLYINGVEYDQAGVRSVQDYLSEDILGIPYYVFNNTISLSINDFKSFIKMSSQDKRSIIDKIFGFHVLNQMRDLLKEENRKIRDVMENLSGRLSSVESTIQSSLNEMENLANQIEQESSTKKEELQKSLQTFEGLQNIHNQKTEEFRDLESQLQNEISNTNRMVIESRTKLQEIQKKIKLYELDQCPTCQSSLDSEFHHCIKDGLVADQASVSSQLEESNSLLSTLREKEREMSSSKRDIMDKGRKIEIKINEIKRDLESLNQSSSDLQLQSLQRIVDNLNVERERMSVESFKSQERNNWLKTLDEILGERGVKQMAIRTILPSLNSEILELLSMMHLDYQVIFDEEFNATIYHMGVEIPTQTLSTGEMKKVDFVVLIAIMKLMKMKFSSINLLFLDELFSSVDPDGVHSILRILRSVCKELGLNIFVINHAPMPHEIFDWKLEVTKANNFSSISIDKF